MPCVGGVGMDNFYDLGLTRISRGSLPEKAPAIWYQPLDDSDCEEGCK